MQFAYYPAQCKNCLQFFAPEKCKFPFATCMLTEVLQKNRNLPNKSTTTQKKEEKKNHLENKAYKITIYIAHLKLTQ